MRFKDSVTVVPLLKGVVKFLNLLQGKRAVQFVASFGE